MTAIRITSIFVIITTFLVAISVGFAANVAIIDYADEWTKVEALAPTLDELGIKYDNLTDDLEQGKLQLKSEHRIFFISSMTTNNATLHANLDKNEKVIHDFVKRGGVTVEPTQADQNEANVDWLPDGLICVRSDPDSPNIKILEPNHSLFNKPNKMPEKEFQGWGHQGWPTVWEVIATQSGFTVLMESNGKPVIMEASYGNGKFIMMSLAPDK